MPPPPLHPPGRLSRARFARRPAAAIIGAAAAGLLATGVAAAVGDGQPPRRRPRPTPRPRPRRSQRQRYESAPYYSTLDSSAPDLGTGDGGDRAEGLRDGLHPGGRGLARHRWDGTDPVSSDTQVGSVINEVRGAGGDVIVSAGGYNGTKLGQVCGSASATAAAYQAVITRYGLHAMDFDLEEPEIENSSAIANELGAAQILQRTTPGCSCR